MSSLLKLIWARHSSAQACFHHFHPVHCDPEVVLHPICLDKFSLNSPFKLVTSNCISRSSPLTVSKGCDWSLTFCKVYRFFPLVFPYSGCSDITAWFTPEFGTNDIHHSWERENPSHHGAQQVLEKEEDDHLPQKLLLQVLQVLKEDLLIKVWLCLISLFFPSTPWLFDTPQGCAPSNHWNSVLSIQTFCIYEKKILRTSFKTKSCFYSRSE